MQAVHSNSTPIRAAERITASSILAKFLPNSPTEHKMSSARRTKPRVSYAESEGSNGSPQSHGKDQDVIHLDEDDEEDEEEDDGDDEIQFVSTSEKKLSSARSLRPRASLQKSTRISKNGAKQTSRSRGRPPKSSGKSNLTFRNDEFSIDPVMSDRQAVRDGIAKITVAKRNRFFVQNKDYFLPLLPESHNYIRKLVEKHDTLSSEEKAAEPTVFPYEQLTSQPTGIKATMKPYQISGLSFMVYLYRNGLSGILGDEMGLGKTLQTLSLVQFLKENEPKSTSQTRPFLIVCPLSVLSSWMAEAKKWAPGLKVLRFHGPIKERDRLKKIASGEIDMYGNMTIKQKKKINSRRTAAGKPLISLDSDDEAEAGELGVDIVVTTYESYVAEQAWFKRAFVWRYAVLDEGHKIKNDMSLVSKGLQGLQAEYRLILTGTPLQNNLTELWALLHWLYPEVFTEQSNELFRTSFDLTKGLYSNTTMDASRHLLELVMLRRMKTSPGVDLNLPPKTEVLLFVPLSPMQRFWYTRLITRADQGLLDDLFKGAKDKERHDMANKEEDSEIKLLEQGVESLEALSNDMVIGSDEWKEQKAMLASTIAREQATGSEDATQSSAWRKLMNLLMQLRKVCNHPYQITNAEPQPYELGDHVINASGKFIVLEKLISELVIKQKKKILIFSGFTKMLDLVEDFLAIRGGDGSEYRFVRLDGSTARARRNLGIRMFNNIDSDYRVMLISTRAGGLGINLATASDVVLLDQDWNPQITLQAEARAHRIGQQNPVTVYKLVSQGTVEEQMMGRIQKKLYLSAKVTESMQDIHTPAGKSKKRKGGPVSADEDMPQLNTGQLMALVRRGASAISRPEIDVNEMLKWDWDTTVAKCKDQPADVNVKMDAVLDATVDEEAEQKWLTEMERVEASIFEGKKLARANGTGKITTSARDIADEWARADVEKANRRVGKNTTVEVDGFMINKESMDCVGWEAIPTMAGKDPRLADVKRAKRPAVNHQTHCQVCLDGGLLYECQLCPRAYHYDCIEPEFQSKAKGWQFNCSQHQCVDCEQKTGDAGGMLYRCRWCERAFCEDCLEWEKTKLIGDNLMEYELLSYPQMAQAFYIECPTCHDHFLESPEDKKVCEFLAKNVEEEYEAKSSEIELASRAGSLTDATTIQSTGVSTPVVIEDDEDAYQTMNGSARKRRRKTEYVKAKVSVVKSKRKAALTASGRVSLSYQENPTA